MAISPSLKMLPEIGIQKSLLIGTYTFVLMSTTGRRVKPLFRVTHDLYGLLLSRKETFKDRAVTATHLRYLIDLVESKKITGG